MKTLLSFGRARAMARGPEIEGCASVIVEGHQRCRSSCISEDALGSKSRGTRKATYTRQAADKDGSAEPAPTPTHDTPPTGGGNKKGSKSRENTYDKDDNVPPATPH